MTTMYEKKASDVKKTEKAVLSAIKYDVDSLAKQFLAEPDLSLTRFGRIFNEMEFSTIFIGRFCNSDLVEFSENLFHYVGSFMFGSLANRPLPEYIQQGNITPAKMVQMFPAPQRRADAERIFGIFMTYSLYFLQPSQFVIPIFVTKVQLDDLYEFMCATLLPDEHFEALYCLYRLIQSDAFTIFPFDGKFNPILNRHFDLLDVNPGETEMRQLENLEDLGQLRSLVQDPIVQQLEAMHRRYTEGKRNTAGLAALAPREGPKDLLDRLIKETEGTLVKMRLRRSAEELERGAAAPSSSSQLDRTNAEIHPKTVLSRRNKIRQQAYSQEVPTRRDRRHRTQAGDEALFEAPTTPSDSEKTNKRREKSVEKRGNTSRTTLAKIKTERVNDGDEIVEEGQQKRKRRRSRSRTAEGDDPVEAAILHELALRTPQKVSRPPTAEPMDMEDNLQRVIDELDRDEAETDESWQQILKQKKSTHIGRKK